MSNDVLPRHLASIASLDVLPRILTDILDQIDQGLLITGTDRRILYANDAFCRMTGYCEAEILGQNCAFLQGPDSDQDTVARIRDCLSRGLRFDGTILNYRKNGEPFWNELNITPILDMTGQISHFVGLQRFISIARKTDFDLRAQGERDHALLDHMLAGVVVHAADTTILYANTTAERLLGLNPGDSIGAVDTDARWGFVREDGSMMPIDEFPVNRAVTTRNDVKNLVDKI